MFSNFLKEYKKINIFKIKIVPSVLSIFTLFGLIALFKGTILISETRQWVF